MSARVLVVDDEAPMRRTLARVLESADYECETAGGVAEARKLLEQGSFDLVVCDMRMPGESGLALVEEIEERYPGLAVLMATAVDDPSIAHTLATHGVHGYLVKPFSKNELLINVDRALQQSQHDREKAEESTRLREEAELRAESVRSAMVDVAEQERMVDEQRVQMLFRLSEAVGRRDLETGAHIRRIGEYSGLLARWHGLPAEEVKQIRRASPMHDIGKIAVPDAILLKPGKLTEEEREVMKRHAQIGHDMLARSGSQLLDLAAQIALTHHEWIDGNGYPQGLKGDEIPLPGRLVAVVDVFDALVSDRPYRPAIPNEKALEIMQDEAGDHLDPELVNLFIDNLPEALTLGRQVS